MQGSFRFSDDVVAEQVGTLKPDEFIASKKWQSLDGFRGLAKDADGMIGIFRRAVDDLQPEFEIFGRDFPGQFEARLLGFGFIRAIIKENPVIGGVSFGSHKS